MVVRLGNHRTAPMRQQVPAARCSPKRSNWTG